MLDCSPSAPTVPGRTRATLSRRRLLTASTAALGAVAASPLPAAAAGRPIVLWGSSSAASYASALTDGFRVVLLDTELARLLDVSVISEARPGARSPEILMARSERHGIDLDFSHLGVRGILPASGQLILPTLDGRVPTTDIPIPGTIAGVHCSARAVVGRHRKVMIRRQEPGLPVEVDLTGGGRWRTSLEARHRGRTHLLWMGKNNILDVDAVLADTRAAFDVEPQTTLVLGHWKTYGDRPGTPSHDAVDAVNAEYSRQYGRQYVDIQAHLVDPRWWDLPELRPYAIGTSAVDRDRLAMGLPPRTIQADDGVHLNRFGYLIVAHALAERLRALALV